MSRRFTFSFIAAAILFFALLCQQLLPETSPQVSAQPTPPKVSTGFVSPQQEAETILQKFTLDEKLDYIGGVNMFSIRAIPRLNLPEIHMADGPMGVRGAKETKPSTSYPAGVGMAATWDADLAKKIGDSMGRDCRARGFHILLAPAVNISRSPLCGRNYEYLGEDPFLAGQTTVSYLQGLQGEGVMGCVKHFAANNEEWDRNRISSEVDERTMREIYLPAFEDAVKQGNVLSVMTGYNLVNGYHCTQNDWLQNQILKKEWGFTGFVVSDWGAVHDAKAAALYGLDLEMPDGLFMNKADLLPLIQDGTIPQAVIDDKVRRILVAIISAGFLNSSYPQLESNIPLDDPKSDEVALEGAHSSIVLLKNEGSILPLKLNMQQTILVVGPNADPAVVGGGGSGHVKIFHATSILAGIRAAAPNATILYHTGLQSIAGQPGFAGQENLKEEAKNADIIIACVGFGQTEDSNSFHFPYNPAWPSDEAQKLGLLEGEDNDRSFALPAAQVETLKQLGALHKKLVVVVTAGAGIDTAGWLDQVPALLYAWYPGQEGGKAVADIITGDVNPSGKLPVTFGKRYEDYPSSPYYKINDKGKTPYTEGVNVGYRGFDVNKIDPLYCFGYGLSYTTFTYSDLKVAVNADNVQVSFSIKNTGSRAGAEVAEVYVTPAPGAVSRPPKELKGFSKVQLAPGETKPVTVTLNSRAFAYWNTPAHQWTVDPGQYGLLIGASERDIRLTGSVTR